MAQRAGEREVAVSYWRKAASVALNEACLPLFVLKMAEECGDGDDLSDIVSEACTVIGQTEDALRGHLREHMSIT